LVFFVVVGVTTIRGDAGSWRNRIWQANKGKRRDNIDNLRRAARFS